MATTGVNARESRPRGHAQHRADALARGLAFSLPLGHLAFRENRIEVVGLARIAQWRLDLDIRSRLLNTVATCQKQAHKQ